MGHLYIHTLATSYTLLGSDGVVHLQGSKGKHGKVPHIAHRVYIPTVERSNEILLHSLRYSHHIRYPETMKSQMRGRGGGRR